MVYHPHRLQNFDDWRLPTRTETTPVPEHRPYAPAQGDEPLHDDYVAFTSPQQELARRLNLVLDLAVTEGDKPLTFRTIADALQCEGIPLSRARWAYMVSGNGPLVTDERLLSGIASVLDVAPAYLLGGADVPRRVEARLDHLRALRTRRVRDFAARSLIDVAPKTLRSIISLLDDDLRRQAADVH